MQKIIASSAQDQFVRNYKELIQKNCENCSLEGKELIKKKVLAFLREKGIGVKSNQAEEIARRTIGNTNLAKIFDSFKKWLAENNDFSAQNLSHKTKADLLRAIYYLANRENYKEAMKIIWEEIESSIPLSATHPKTPRRRIKKAKFGTKIQPEFSV